MNLNTRGYGDLDNLYQDAKTLRAMLDRQGTNFLIDVLSDKVGETVNKFSMTDKEIKQLKLSLINELTEMLNERT